MRRPELLPPVDQRARNEYGVEIVADFDVTEIVPRTIVRRATFGDTRRQVAVPEAS